MKKRSSSKGESRRALLAQIDLFRGLSTDLYERIVAQSSCVMARRDEVLFHAGERGDTAMFVACGSVVLTTPGMHERPLAVELIVPTQPFGLFAILHATPYPLSAVALEQSVILRIPASLIREAAAHVPNVEHSLLELASARFADALRVITNLAKTSARERIAYACTLLLQRRFAHLGAPFVLPIARRQIAVLAGTTIETCIRVVKEFEREGLVRMLRPRCLEIVQPDALRLLAHGI